MTHCLTALWIGMGAIAAAAGPAAAQQLRPAVSGALAVANVYRSGDQSFGTHLNVGGGAGFDWRRLGIDAEVHRTLGLTPRTVQCHAATVPCTGSAREGFLDATVLSANLTYFFGTARARPYLKGGVGVLWTESVNSITTVTGAAATLSEFQEKDTGLIVGIGFGVDVPVTAALSLRPEFASLSAVAMARVNLGIHRGTIAVRYRW